VTKLAGEHYCRVFTEVFGLETVVLRYFNVYGPRQRHDSAYAAVIPLFIRALLDGRPPVVHGDGTQTRDFTFVDDVVEANLAAARAAGPSVPGRTFNIARGEAETLLDLLGTLAEILGVQPSPSFVAPRPGDVRSSRADVSAAREVLGFRCAFTLGEGLRRTVAWHLATQAPAQGR
jgi:nucleoside-diphosphate-sugar epimerase